MNYMTKKSEDNLSQTSFTEDDPTAASRKKDHIELAFKSSVESDQLDERFYYEPLLAAHPEENQDHKIPFLGKILKNPIWISSMTGGTEMANTINHNLARACKDFGLGMGLGSCRSLLFSDEYLADFNVRPIIGSDFPLYANLGLAQIEKLIVENELWRLSELLKKLDADGLIIHVNPFQEWLQPEGDRFEKPPLETIQRVLDFAQFPVIIKEVGQGMGYESLKALFQMPLEAIDFAASGGTNFSKLELLRTNPVNQNIYMDLARVGHTAEDMVGITNNVLKELGEKTLVKQVIISGGVKNFLDGYYLINKLATHSIYGQASGFLKRATGEYEELYNYVDAQVKGLKLAKAFLRIR